MMLACPINQLGTVTLFQATHHGFTNGQSGAPAMVWAVKPQVVIVNDGARKGFVGDSYDILSKIPGLENIWQLHRSLLSDAAHNTSDQMTANVEEGDGDHGLGIAPIVAIRSRSITNPRARIRDVIAPEQRQACRSPPYFEAMLKANARSDE